MEVRVELEAIIFVLSNMSFAEAKPNLKTSFSFVSALAFQYICERIY